MILVLGGGVAGAALAWALTRRGRRDVRVVDPRPLGSGSTTRALGGFRTQHGTALNIALSLASRPFFEARAERIDFRPVGYLYLAETAEAAAELERRAALQRDLGLPITHPDPESLVPGILLDDIRGANYCALDATYRPARILDCLVEEARTAGAEFRYSSEPVAIDPEASPVIVCTGAWSGEVGESMGVRLGVEPVERGIFQVGPFDWLQGGLPVVLDAGSGYHFRERDGRLLVIGPGDQNEWGHCREWLARRLPRAAVERPEDHWTGNYEVTFDHHPLVGPTERPGVWAMCGFSGHGVMHSPAVAASLAAMILGETPPIDLSALSPLRTSPLRDPTQV